MYYPFHDPSTIRPLSIQRVASDLTNGSRHRQGHDTQGSYRGAPGITAPIMPPWWDLLIQVYSGERHPPQNDRFNMHTITHTTGYPECPFYTEKHHKLPWNSQLHLGHLQSGWVHKLLNLPKTRLSASVISICHQLLGFPPLGCHFVCNPLQLPLFIHPFNSSLITSLKQKPNDGRAL